MKRLIIGVLALLASASLSVAEPPTEAHPVKYLSAASNNATLVQVGRVRLLAIAAVNTTATIYYLKFYDKATAPTCGTDTPVWTLPLLVSTVAPTLVPTPDGLEFFAGLGFCLVANLVDSDNTNAATGVAINLGIK
jgi:hypothetical protein